MIPKVEKKFQINFCEYIKTNSLKLVDGEIRNNLDKMSGAG